MKRNFVNCFIKVFMFGILFVQIIFCEDYNEYCYFSVGFMGLGFICIFYIVGMEQFIFDYFLNVMGLFLQVWFCFSCFIYLFI